MWIVEKGQVSVLHTEYVLENVLESGYSEDQEVKGAMIYTRQK
jgi:hypothetical protein